MQYTIPELEILAGFPCSIGNVGKWRAFTRELRNRGFKSYVINLNGKTTRVWANENPQTSSTLTEDIKQAVDRVMP